MKNFNNSIPIDLQYVQSLLRQAGKLGLRRQSQLIYTLKPDSSIVTDVDKEIESFLINKIHQTYPDHTIISEEGVPIKRGSAYTWAIDPLDGTRVYYGGLSIWGISIGIMLNRKPHLGLFYLPKLDEMYMGSNKTAFLNGKPLTPVLPIDIEAPTTFLAVPSQCHRLFDIEIKRLRSFGSLAAHLAYVARGAAIGALTQHANIWDIAAMLPILHSVGVQAKYLSGEVFKLSDLRTGPSEIPLVFAHGNVINEICARIQWKKK